MNSIDRIWVSRLALKVNSLIRSRISVGDCGDPVALEGVDLHQHQVAAVAVIDQRRQRRIDRIAAVPVAFTRRSVRP